MPAHLLPLFARVYTLRYVSVPRIEYRMRRTCWVAQRSPIPLVCLGKQARLKRHSCNIQIAIYSFSQYTKVVACGRHHKRGGAAFGRATFFVVSFVSIVNLVNIVAVATILVLHVGVIGHHAPRH